MEQNDQNNKKPMNPLVIAGAIYAVVVMVLVGAIIAVRVTRGNRSGRPTPELAKSVCEKYGGVFEEMEASELGKSYNCTGKKGTAAFLANGAQFTIGFADDDKKAEFWAKSKESISNNKGYEDISGYIVLENTDDFIKAYVTVAGLVRMYLVAYDNAIASVVVQSDSVAEEMIAELGFPDGKRAENYRDDNGNTTSTASIKASQNDTQRRDDYSMLVTALNSYLVNNRGTFDDMVNEDNDPRTLTASRWINSDGKDPNGNLYDLKAYTYETWSNTDEIPVDDNGSQVFVIIHANCHGTDSNGDPMPAEDASKRAFAVYGYLESDGYFCQASGSAS